MSFEQFLYGKLHLLLPPDKELSKGGKRSVEALDGSIRLISLIEEFTIEIKEAEFKKAFKFEDLVEEYFSPLTTEIDRGPTETFALYLAKDTYSLAWSWFPDRLKVTIESIPIPQYRES